MEQKDHLISSIGSFTNAYATYNGKSDKPTKIERMEEQFPAATNYTHNLQKTLDHIWYNTEITCTEVLETPSDE